MLKLLDGLCLLGWCALAAYLPYAHFNGGIPASPDRLLALRPAVLPVALKGVPEDARMPALILRTGDHPAMVAARTHRDCYRRRAIFGMFGADEAGRCRHAQRDSGGSAPPRPDTPPPVYIENGRWDRR